MFRKLALISILSILFFFSPREGDADHVYKPFRLSDLPQTQKISGLTQASRPAFGDLNGDGKADMALADPAGKGQVYIFLNLASMLSQKTISLEKADSFSFRLDGRREREPIGTFIQIADVDQDGKADLVIGREDGQSAYYLSGPLTAPERGRVFRLDRSKKLNFPGKFISFTDLDSDGSSEFIVRNELGDWQVYYNTSELWFTIHGLSSQADATGVAVATLLNHKGPSMIIGDPGAGMGGVIFLLSLPTDPKVTLDVIDRKQVEQWDSPWSGAGFGKSIGVFDINNDEQMDILVSCATNRRWVGMYGPIVPAQPFHFEVQESPPLFWTADVDGNNLSDVFVGPPYRWLVNTAPVVQIQKAAEQENGWARIELGIADAEGQDVDVELEYKRRDTWTRAGEAMVRGNRKIAPGKGKIVEWNIAGDFPDQFSEEGVEYRLHIHDHHFLNPLAVVDGIPFPIDTKVPSVQLEQPEFREDGKVAIAGNATDDSSISKIQFRIDGGDWQETIVSFPPLNEPEEAFSVEFPGSDEKTYRVEVQATDKYGNKSPISQTNQLQVQVPSGTFGVLSQMGTRQTESEFSPVTLFPNPYSISSGQPIRVQYGLAMEADAKIYVYSIGGVLAWQGTFSPGGEGGKRGINQPNWDARGNFGEQLSTGIYSVKLVSGGKLHSSTRLIVTN